MTRTVIPGNIDRLVRRRARRGRALLATDGRVPCPRGGDVDLDRCYGCQLLHDVEVDDVSGRTWVRCDASAARS